MKLGLIPGGGGIRRLAEAGGTRWAKDVIISARTLYPEEALERDVVSRIVPAGELLDTAIHCARDFATDSPAAWTLGEHLQTHLRNRFGRTG